MSTCRSSGLAKQVVCSPQRAVASRPPGGWVGLSMSRNPSIQLDRYPTECRRSLHGRNFKVNAQSNARYRSTDHLKIFTRGQVWIEVAIKSVLQLLASLRSHCAPRLAWEIAYEKNLAPLGRVKLSAGTAQN